MKKTALVTHEECLQHVTPPGHPEQVARLEYILEALKDNKIEINRKSLAHMAVHEPDAFSDLIKNISYISKC